MPGTYKERGEVDSVRTSSDGKHVHVAIVHGKRKKLKKHEWDDRRRTEFSIPKAEAGGYTAGAKVVIAIRVVGLGQSKRRQLTPEEEMDEMYGGKGV